MPKKKPNNNNNNNNNNNGMDGIRDMVVTENRVKATISCFSLTANNK